MRKYLLGGLAALLAVSLCATAAFAGTSGSLTFTSKFTQKKTGAPTGVTTDIEEALGDTHAKIADVVTIGFPSGTTFNPKSKKAAICTATDAAGVLACPAASVIGSGTALADSRPLLPVPIAETVTVYNGPKDVKFLLRPAGAIGQTAVIVANEVGSKLVANVPAFPTIPGAPDAALTSFKVTIGASKQVLITPKRCRGRSWTITDTSHYTDGSSAIATDKTPCIAPKRK